MKTHPNNSNEIRQAYLDYFKSQGHTIVPSSSLLPTSPNLLFTNSGMNQFVPYFLGERVPTHTRVADTQKCIRAGGKHNDLDDVGFDGYHHTFFEMLGNWSFGDYFKKESIDWAWHLLTKIWGFPKERLYATVYKPGPQDPATFDQEAYDLWESIFTKEGLDPKIHICFGNKKDNFWMMGETGPCGPCTEIHMDLTPNGDTQGKLVNADSPWCIELWNLVFIQFNADETGTFSPLPQKHVDTGMGFERIAGILATTKNFTNYSQPPSNYNSDLFTDIFQHIENLSGLQYTGTLPSTKDRKALSKAEYQDCTFRVLADHIRTLSCSIADGILPGNEGRNYVLRRILRRAVLFGKRLGLKPGFLTTLVDPLVEKLGPIFPELKQQLSVIKKVLTNEEASFERTLDRGLQMIEGFFQQPTPIITGEQAFTLYDTYGFPLDLTEIMAEERGFSVNKVDFELEMERQRQRARAAQTKNVIKLASEKQYDTLFVGYTRDNEISLSTKIMASESITDAKGHTHHYLITAETPCYAEMGGQAGDYGYISYNGETYAILNTTKDTAEHILHSLDRPFITHTETTLEITLDTRRRRSIERHHSAVHLLHWALRKVLGTHIAQAGSYVGPDYFRFDFSHFEAISPENLQEIENLIQSAIFENHPVQTQEVPFEQKPADVLAFFQDKYGALVRVVDIGGFSKELCGGTHVRSTAEIGPFKITHETAIAAGTRRIEGVCGESACKQMIHHYQKLSTLAQRLSCKTDDILQRLEDVLNEKQTLEKKLRQHEQKAVSIISQEIEKQCIKKDDINLLQAIVPITNPEDLKSLSQQLIKKIAPAVVLLGMNGEHSASLVAACSPEAIQKGYHAGQIIQKAATLLGGKGGGRPDFAMGGGKNVTQLTKAIKMLHD